ncbi:FG-GAP repeat protein, partial [Desulfuromonas sp. TF]|uniref:FG-GAP repeat protein n=1 Tax=Desulfuromonas sp. TF TaxID=1232410 RepID=UPI00187270EA
MNVSKAAASLCLCMSILLFAGCGSRDGDSGGDGPTPPTPPPPGFEPLASISADPPQAAAQFGTAVAVDGFVAVVGAPFEDEGGIADRGAAYVFRFSASGTWDLERRLVAPDGAMNDQFGSSVAVSGDQIIVGAPLRDEGGIADRGGAYIFRRTDPITATWELTATL